MTATTPRPWKSLIYDLAIILVLVLATLLRSVGLDWDQSQHLHPDERFLTMVETGIMPPGTDPAFLGMAPNSLIQKWREAYPQTYTDCAAWGGYFDTGCSTLNPANRGFTFYVYGTLPIFAVRYTAEWLGQTGYDQVHLVGRMLSLIADVLTIFMLYLIVTRLYGQAAGLLAAAFSALAVLQIQQAHFFTVDTFTNLFMYAAIYFGVRVAQSAGEWRDGQIQNWKAFARHPLFWFSLGFGLMLGLAAASKINAIVLALMLPGAMLVGLLGRKPRSTPEQTLWAIGYLVVGGLAALLAFRIFQPYAFSGPGFFGLRPSELWLANLKELSAQASGNVDFPPALQWARRPLWFAWQNMIVWGLGLPLGIAAWGGFLWMGARILRGQWKPHILLWLWTGLYSLWQGTVWNRTMRYQLAIYPLLAMFAAWGIVELFKLDWRVLRRRVNLARIAAVLMLVVTLAGTAVWATAFVQIYTRPQTRVAASEWIFAQVPGPLNIVTDVPGQGLSVQPLAFPYGGALQAGAPHLAAFTPQKSGELIALFFYRLLDTASSGPQTISAELVLAPGQPEEQVLARAEWTEAFTATDDPRGREISLTFDRRVPLTAGQTYILRLSVTGGALTPSGAAPVNETSWDDGLPLRMPGFDAFGGIYQGGLSLELYWPDNADKLARIQQMLDAGDFIFISSNRQWATTTRVPERYPLTTAYYRALLGCPASLDVIWCYNVAQPGSFHGQLGYDLVAVFESYPGFGDWRINDQFAEEAFTVYDHPKVLIFQKSPDYDPARVGRILGAVDLTRVVNLIPIQANSYPGDLMLPADRLAGQQAGGTWSELFDTQALINRQPALAAVVWYLFLFVLGLLVYPLVRTALPGLQDRGWPLARLIGMLLLAYIVWLLGSFGVTFSRLTIGLTFAGLAGAGMVSAWLQRRDLRTEWHSNRRVFLIAEALFLAFFLFDLTIRILNPDLWHPSKGGERPMDFSYLNAILKSTSFPPYDPWLSGGYINYYYWGLVLAATPVKLLGIVPAVAYNLLVPTMFALTATAACSLAWNLVRPHEPLRKLRLAAGIAGGLLMAVLGNLGTIQTVYQAFQRMAAPGGVATFGNFFQKVAWAAQGFVKSVTGTPLPLGRGEWYWNPSRVLPSGPGNEITEFPFFTFLYGDLHAHMIAMPLALLVLAWVLSFVLARGRWNGRLAAAAGFLLGGLAVGVLRPANTWDIYTYLPLACIAVGYTLYRYFPVERLRLNLPEPVRRMIVALAGAGLLAGLAVLLFQPYAHWFGQGYNEITYWRYSRTPLGSYLTHWGLLLFLIASWMTWETRQWMAVTPVSALGRLRRYQILIETVAGLFVSALVILTFMKAAVVWIALPLALWALILILRPDQPDVKRLVLFMIGTALALTLAVELFTVVGDIGRMNTIFKLYLQAWALLAISAAAAFGWLWPEITKWTVRWESGWKAALTMLVFGASLFTLTGTLDKVRDRMAAEAPIGLDSMAYMPYAVYGDQGVVMSLDEDFRAIRWMQENVPGSPVIVEANTVEYRWGSRFTIYTGLPGVVGWNWHQRQQRALTPSTWVTDRVDAINAFYLTSDPAAAYAFLSKYHVTYIIVGQLERAYFPEASLLKFEQYDGQLWDEVYRDGQTVIYEVRR